MKIQEEEEKWAQDEEIKKQFIEEVWEALPPEPEETEEGVCLIAFWLPCGT